MTVTYLATLADVGAGVPSGTAFPGGPASGDLFHRTNLNPALWRYDGTRWRSESLYQFVIGPADAVIPYSANKTARAIAPIITGSDIWLVSHQTWFFVSGGTALSGSHKWVGTLNSVSGGTIATVTIDSGASDTHRQSSVTAIGALMGSGAMQFGVDWVKTGTPGTLFTITAVAYQHVAT